MSADKRWVIQMENRDGEWVDLRPSKAPPYSYPTERRAVELMSKKSRADAMESRLWNPRPPRYRVRPTSDGEETTHIDYQGTFF
jgi:hypothetical protein